MSCICIEYILPCSGGVNGSEARSSNHVVLSRSPTTNMQLAMASPGEFWRGGANQKKTGIIASVLLFVILSSPHLTTIDPLNLALKITGVPDH